MVWFIIISPVALLLGLLGGGIDLLSDIGLIDIGIEYEDEDEGEPGEQAIDNFTCGL